LNFCQIRKNFLFLCSLICMCICQYPDFPQFSLFFLGGSSLCQTTKYKNHNFSQPLSIFAAIVVEFLWKLINKVIHYLVEVKLNEIPFRISKQIDEQFATLCPSASSETTSNTPILQLWKRPPPNFLKINCDTTTKY
jgi:hypothetical protein